MRVWTAMRRGSFLRIFFSMLCLSWGLLGVSGASLWTYGAAVVAAGTAALATSLWIASTYRYTISAWKKAAIAAAKEDFSVPLPSASPLVLQPISGLLEEARRTLSTSLNAARREKALLDSIVNAMNEGVVSVNALGEIGLVNRGALTLFGHPATQDQRALSGRPLVALARDPRLNEVVDRVLRDGNAMAGETEILATRRTVIFSVAPIVEPGARVKGAVIALTDATNLRKLERVRQDFVTNVSHELKTPIAAIRGWSETLVSGMLAIPDELVDPLQTIYRQSLRLSALVDDLLVLARAESGVAPETSEAVHLERMIDSIELAFDEVIVTKGIDFDVEIDDAVRVFETARTALEYIVRNLIDNALKYTKSGGQVSVRARASESGGLILAVRDSGPGIEAHHLQRIFERFYRVDEGRHRDVGGTGLGLSIVKNYATSMGGRVWVESEVGKGSTFLLELPPRAASAE